MKIQIPRKKLEEFCRRNHIVRFSLFGSALREDYRPDSDIDMLVVFEKNHVPGFIGLSRMERELSSILGGKTVDLRTPEDLSRFFRDRVVNESRVFYEAA